MQSSYPLYANLEKAQENSLSEVPTTTLSLSAETLPDVQAGSVVLYRKFAVGEIIAVKPRKTLSISICISSRSTATC
ncbi:Paraquat-inducible protein B [Klebsiella aerogenes]|nr:Paraquat-inducible protein B [Klebsiella aerogenes]